MKEEIKHYAVVNKTTSIVENVILGTKSFKSIFEDENLDMMLLEYIEKFDNDEEVARIGETYIPGVGFVFEDFKTDEEIEQQRILSIKAEAGRIIESKYSIFKQLNITNSLDGYTPEDKIEMIAFINAIRAISNKAELEGVALENINWNT